MKTFDKNNSIDPMLTEDVIKIQDYKSSESLKTDIRKIINDRQRQRWRLHDMVSRGPFISLTFKQKEPI